MVCVPGGCVLGVCTRAVQSAVYQGLCTGAVPPWGGGCVLGGECSETVQCAYHCGYWLEQCWTNGGCTACLTERSHARGRALWPAGVS